ncbi:MAG: hypothetical protein HN576_06055 [Bacteriovoracaceae bacterium]|jgi:hypothetical protein|nr:hypothetical protein [Bacteriovoracaceae bacterium]
MKIAIFIIAILCAQSSYATSYQGSSVDSVWEQMTSDQYKKPQNKISFASLIGFFKNKIKQSAERTLSDKSDILPQFNKLAHPNGVCLRGKWEITKENPYTGQFRKGTIANIIARASTAMSGTKKGELRGFGFAGKLFPIDENDLNPKVKTANFFLVDDLGGTKADHYTDVEMTNEPAASKTTQVLLHLAYALKLAITFGKADENPGMRQLYEISELNETQTRTAKTPKWMKVSAVPGQKVNEKDFRDELNIKNYRGTLAFNIDVASKEDEKGNKNWKTIGKINMTDSVVSNSCDHRLHFHHPKWKNNLRH